MNKHYFFRKGDFFKWHKAYIECREYLKIYRYYYNEEKRKEEYTKYKEAKELVEGYNVYICSLSEEDKIYLQKAINERMFNLDELKLHPSVLENWEAIVLNSNKYNLTDVDLKAFGKKLKYFRERSGFYRAEAARYVGIAERTLKAYEDGEREIGINALYKLMRLYGVGDISNFFI